MMGAPTLGPYGAKLLESRKINPETGARYELYTARFDRAKKQVVPDDRGDIICFPFIQREAIIGEKYRAPDKKFWQRPGAKRIFWNWDALLDPALVNGTHPLVITEGEFDALAAIDCGFPLTVSVPDGAPPVPVGSRPDELPPLDPKNEASSKFDFVYEARDQLRRIKRFVIAVDNDDPGQRLAAELVRRLGAARCAFVEYPKGCKDLNDVLMKYDSSEVVKTIMFAKPYPVKGLYRMSEAPDLPDLVVYSTGWEVLDQDFAGMPRMQVYPGALMVVTGIPSSGKSTWISNLIVNLAKQYRWSAAIFSPEMPMVPHYRKLLRDIINAPNQYNADLFIEKHFVFIANDPDGIDDDDMTVDWLLEKAADAVIRDGIKVLVVDPWNEIEHARQHGESMVDYIGRTLRAFKRFARRYEVLVIIIAHPTKDIVRDGRPRVPVLYDIEGAAHWFNKCDFGVTIEREEQGSKTSVHVQKVRFRQAGLRGTVNLTFDSQTSRYVTYRDASAGMML